MKSKIVIMFMIFSVSYYAQNITLNDAINLALQKNEKILQYKSRLNSKEYENKAAWGNFLPSINLQGSYNHLNKELSIDLAPIRDAMIQLQANNTTELTNIYNILGGNSPFTPEQKYSVFNQTVNTLESSIPAFTETFKRQDYNSASFVGIQPLFLGGKLIAAKKYASAEEKAAQFELEKTENEIINNTVKAYLRNLLLNEVVITRKNVLSGIKQHQENAKKLFEQGLIAKHHLLRAEVAVAEAERNLFNDQNDLELAQIAFKSLVGIEENKNIVFSDTLKFKELTNSLTEFLEKAELNQPIIKIIEQKKIFAQQNYNVARSEFMPQVAAFGKYELYPEYLSSLEPRWAVGVQAKLNLFNGFKDYLKLESASAVEDEVEHIKRDAEKNIKLWINKTYREVKNNAVEYQKLTSSLKLAEENFRQNSKRFNSGLGTSLEVIDASLALEKIEIDRHVALYNYYCAIADLENAAGKTINLLKIWNN